MNIPSGLNNAQLEKEKEKFLQGESINPQTSDIIKKKTEKPEIKWYNLKIPKAIAKISKENALRQDITLSEYYIKAIDYYNNLQIQEKSNPDEK